MKKLFYVIAVAICLFGVTNMAHAIPIGVTNLLLNSSFEDFTTGDGFDDWTESGEWYRDSRAYDGSYSARLGVTTGGLYQTFSLTSGDTLYFGAQFRFITNGYVANWDSAQINMQVNGLPDTTIGGDVNSFYQDLNWSLLGGTTYLSDWFTVDGMVDLSGVTLPANSAMNISLQNFSDPNTRVIVDDAYAGVASAAPVPEPSTLLLLGGGLSGLAWYRRKRKKE